MLREVKGLHGDALRARDGDIGKVDEILFDDQQWTLRYLVVDTGGWLQDRQVLIAPPALGALEWDQHLLNVNLTRDQVENSPSIRTNEPVSRQWETQYHDYYGWPYYWQGGMGYAGGYGISGGMALSGALILDATNNEQTSQEVKDEQAKERKSEQDHRDVHLRSTREITGYGIAAHDGNLGHVEDFIFDDQNWQIRYLAVDTKNWWPGKKVLVPVEWIDAPNWLDRTVTVNLDRDHVRNAPEWNSHERITSAYEDELSAYYAGLRRDGSASPTEQAHGSAEHVVHSR